MKRIASFVIVALLSTAAAVNAAVIYDGFPPPGGVTTSPTGSPGSGGSRTYFNFDTTAWDELYFGYEVAVGPLAPFVGQNLIFDVSTLGTSELVWNAPLPWMRDFGSGPVATPVRLRNSFANLAGNINITSSVVASATVPIIPGPLGQYAPYVLPIDDASLALWGGGFKSVYAIEGFFNGVWTPVNLLPSIHSGGTATGLGGAFWHETDVAAIPEPASMFLLGSGLVGMAITVRRRRTRA